MTKKPGNTIYMEMKRLPALLVLIIFIGPQAYSQNYALVDTGRLSLFSNGWDTRGIEIESISASGNGGTLFTNYPSVELTSDGARLMSDKGWLGGTVTRENGVDIIVNYVGVTLNFATEASVGHSWQFYVDDIDHIVTASIDTVIEETFIGITDSVKYISFETTFLGNSAPGWIDSVNMRVSKNSGLVEGFNFYEFPQFYSNTGTSFKVSHHFKWLIDYEAPETSYTLVGLRDNSSLYGEGLLTPPEIFDIPDTLRYTRLHNVNEYYNGGYGGNWNTYFDHLVINDDITANTSNIDAHTCYQNDWEEYTGTGTNYNTSSGVIDTMTIVSTYSGVWLEGRPYEYRSTANGVEVALHLRSEMGRRMTFLSQWLETGGQDSLLFDNEEKRIAYMDELGQVYDYQDASYGASISWNYDADSWRLMYYRIGSEEWIGSTGSFIYAPYQFDHDCIDSYIPEDSTGVGIIEITEDLKLYPNPSSGVVTIESIEGESAQLYDIHGQLIGKHKLKIGQTQIEIQQPGLYILRGRDWTERIVITE